MNRLHLLGSLALAAVSATAQQPAGTPPYRDPSLPVEQRVHDLLGRMTPEEKASMLAGSGWMESTPIPRLGIPAIKMADGPMGIRNWTGRSAVTNKQGGPKFSSTAFPAGVAMAATWDTALVEQEGKAIGQEVASIGRDMILGPTVNIQRAPLWGRNFEGYGEDPYLAGRMAVGYIQGVQSQGVIASVKHFVANNQEFERHRIDVALDDRSLHEIYFPAFEAAVRDGKAWSVMTSYNRINGVHAAESPLVKRAFNAWGFDGFFISDWGSTYSTAATVNAGMGLEMPGGEAMREWIHLPETVQSGNDGGYLTPEKVLPLVRSGAIPQANIDDNVARVLRVLLESGIYDHPHTANSPIDTPPQRALARKAAAESLVLLKNDGALLPLDFGKLHSVAVIGPNAAVARTGGGGSSLVFARDTVSPLQGIQERAGALTVRHAPGVAMAGEDAAQDTPAARAKSIAEAVALAKQSDVALVFVGYSSKFESEGYDRKTMDLPDGQDDLIQAVAAANPKTVVVLNAGDPVTLTRWIGKVPAVLDAFYGGEETGHALADVLFGDVTPSGKLPFSFIRRLEDSPSNGHYPGENLQVTYAEGLAVGYRYFDRHPEVAPLFPFGYGLSYTRFDYSGLELPKQVSGDAPVQVSLKLRNVGSRPGAEVVELYVSEVAPRVDRPVRELKGFQRVELAPGETRTVTLALNRRAFSFFDTAQHAWVAKPGQFRIEVGGSSRDLKLSGDLQLTQ